MSNQQKSGLRFVILTHPDESGMWKREVRSHAARNSLARQNRVISYQNEKLHGARQRVRSEAGSFASSRVLGHAAPAVMRTPDISMTLSPAKPDPFDTFARKITQFEGYLLNYFIQKIVRQADVGLEFRAMADEVAFRQGMATHWVQTAATDVGLLAALFLAASRHLSAHHHLQVFSTLTMQYKGECISTLNECISQEGSVISDLTITKTLALASDAILTGDYFSSNRHLDAARRMVATRSDKSTLRMSELLRRLVIWLTRDPSPNGNPRLSPCLCVANKNKLPTWSPGAIDSSIASVQRDEQHQDA